MALSQFRCEGLQWFLQCVNPDPVDNIKPHIISILQQQYVWLAYTMTPQDGHFFHINVPEL